MQVRVVRTLDAPLPQVWETLVSPHGTQAMLGPGATFGCKGEPWHSDEGPSGVLRSYHPLEQLRWSWHESPDAPASIVELDLHEHGEGTRLDVSHDGVEDVAAYQVRWAAALDRLGGAAAG